MVLYHMVGTTSCCKHTLNSVSSTGISVLIYKTSLGKLSIPTARPVLATIMLPRTSSVVIGLFSSKLQLSLMLEFAFWLAWPSSNSHRRVTLCISDKKLSS